MKIGIFDSGLGGLVVFRSVVKKLPQYDYVYLGDTKRVPYGDRSHETIYQFTKEAVDFLFKHGCQLIIIACSTASARALRRIQQEYLPANYPNRRVLGVIVPMAENTIKSRKVGLLATNATVNSGTMVAEISKRNTEAEIIQQPAPLLVPMIENGEEKFSNPILKGYLDPLISKKIDTLVLGCTHYPILKNRIKKIIGNKIKIICPNEALPDKLKDYLLRHPNIEKKLSKKGSRAFWVTDITKNLEKHGKKWFGKDIEFKKINLL